MSQRFEELVVWQKARLLTNRLYAVTGQDVFARDFGLRDQLRRAAVSVMSNIAEGYERRGSRLEFVRFLRMAKGSYGEIRCQLYIARDQGYLPANDLSRLHEQSIEVSRMLQGLVRALIRRRP